MDGFEWNNNSGSFTASVAFERDQTGANMFLGSSPASPSPNGLVFPIGRVARRTGRKRKKKLRVIST